MAAASRMAPATALPAIQAGISNASANTPVTSKRIAPERARRAATPLSARDPRLLAQVRQDLGFGELDLFLGQKLHLRRDLF